MVIFKLLLQKPHHRSTSKEHRECLLRRLELWKNGEIGTLLREGKTIQARLKTHSPPSDEATIAKKFASLIFEGNGRAAMRYVTEEKDNGVLELTEETIKQLHAKHPHSETPPTDSLRTGDIPAIDLPTIFAT